MLLVGLDGPGGIEALDHEVGADDQCLGGGVRDRPQRRRGWRSETVRASRTPAVGHAGRALILLRTPPSTILSATCGDIFVTSSEPGRRGHADRGRAYRHAARVLVPAPASREGIP